MSNSLGDDAFCKNLTATTITDINGQTGLVGQVLSSTALGIDWQTGAGIVPQDLQSVCNVGNITDTDIIQAPTGSLIQDQKISILTNTITNPIAIGFGVNTGIIGTIGIGSNTGSLAQGDYSIAIGENAGISQGITCIAIGDEAGTDQLDGTIAIGFKAGQLLQGVQALAIGYGAGQNQQELQTIAIGYEAGNITQRKGAIAVGISAGFQNQATDSVAIGHLAGTTNEGNNGVAIGTQSGELNLQPRAITIGVQAGQQKAGQDSISIGTNAGNNMLSAGAVAIGLKALSVANNACGYSVAIGANALDTIPPFSNFLVLNATGQTPFPNFALYPPADGGRCYINPIRKDDQSHTSNSFLHYDVNSREVYSTPATFGSFSSDLIQTVLGVNVPTIASYNIININAGVSVVLGTRITLSTKGVYRFMYSIQYDKTGAGATIVNTWVNVNGVPSANSNSQSTILNVNDTRITSVEYIYSFVSGDYFEILFQSADATVHMESVPAGGGIPLTPSIILTINKIN